MRPTGLDLLRLVADAYLYQFPTGTRGWQADQTRSGKPEPGDFVVVECTGSTGSASQMGWLLSTFPTDIYPGVGYEIETPDGNSVIRWTNVKVRAIPVGNQFDRVEINRWQPVQNPMTQIVPE